MALAHSPRIVTDGLVLALDAGNLKSYDKYENLLPYSIVSETGWSSASSTLTPNATTAPDGTNTAARIQVSGSGYVARLNIPVSAGTTYILSFWLKSVSGSGTWGINIYDHATGVGHNRTTVNITEEWQRVSYSYTPTGTQVNVYISDDRDSLATISDGYVWGAQLERGESLTDYYATTGTAKTRGSVISSGIGTLTGTLTNGVGYDNDNGGSLSFDGVDDYSLISLNNPSGDWIHSIEFWMNMNQNQSAISARQDPFQIGTPSISRYSAVDISNNNFNWYFYGNDCRVTTNLFVANTWYHIGLTYTGGGATSTNKQLYVNGVNVPFNTSGSANLNIPANSTLSIGRDHGRTTAHFNGKIANFKIYNKALTASEIQQNFNALRGRFSI